MQPDTKNELKQIVVLLREYAKRNNVEFDKFAIALNELEDEMEKITDDVDARFEEERKKLLNTISNIKIGDKGEQGKKGDRGEKGKGVDGTNGKDGRDGVDGKDGTNGTNGKDGKDGSILELSPTDIRDSLETLKGDERLDKSAIKGLDDIDKDIKALQERPVGGKGHSGAAVHPMKFFPLTADGVTKTFSVPKSLNSVVLTSDFPYILFETTGARNNGFTINAARTQITLTTDNAPSPDAQLLYQFSSVFNY